VISRLQPALLGAFGRRPTLVTAHPELRPGHGTRRAGGDGAPGAGGDSNARIEAARRRLKAAIPPPPD
jgi:hypothetical protein